MLNLKLCVSQTPNENPFAFKTTGVRVFSFEEVLYHVFHHWRESADEFLGDELISWVAGLGHSYLAARMKELRKKEQFAAKIIEFLKLADYFSDEDLAGLRGTLDEWQQRREWEQLKERGDFFARKNEPQKAIEMYKRALQFEENAAILNNLGVQYMRISATKEGLSCMIRANALEPKNFAVLLHYIEAAILNGSYDKAAKAIQKAFKIDPNCADIAFLLGLMSFEQKDYPTALTYFEKAMEMDKTVAYYAHKAADIHLRTRQFEKALSTLQKITVRDADFYAKEAEIYAAWGDNARAIRSMTLALATGGENDATLHAKKAAYHRRDYDSARAEYVIQKAVALSPENNTVRLENARIKKAVGKTQDYQLALTEILKSFRDGYRA